MKSQNTMFLKIVSCAVIMGIFSIPAFTQTVSKTPVHAVTKKAGSTTAKTNVSPLQWSMEVGPVAKLRLLTPNKQIFSLDNRYNMAVIENGKINVYQYNEENQWQQLQTLEVTEVSFTTLMVKDLNHDQVPEIIGGTTEPGFIYIYYRDQNGQWLAKKEAKYIWSTVAKMSTAHLAANSAPVLVVQNKEGFLFVLKPSETALDLIWKSPVAWKPLENIAAVDVDHDGCDELIVVYKNGGVAVLRSVKNALKSVWEYFPWGKVLSVNYQDWDNNNTLELVLPTTQKLVCVINFKNKSFAAAQESVDYMIEKLFFGKFQNRTVRLTTDTSGKTHFAEYAAKSAKHWKETQVIQTGRVLEVFQQGPDEISLITQSLQLIKVKINPVVNAPDVL